MQLCYFDENKHSSQSPDFFIGGIIIPDTKATSLEQTLSRLSLNYFGSSSLTKSCEFHGKEIFHGKGASKGKKMEARIQVFRDFSRLIIDNQIPIRIVRIDVLSHLAKYKYPMETYKLGLMLTLEKFAQYLKSTEELGMVFGDYEADEISRAVVDFSEYKKAGKTPLQFGRDLRMIIDTVYFTHSHHSRFLRLTDLIIFMAGRYERLGEVSQKWHEREMFSIWTELKQQSDLTIKRWP
jgi:hypothetical protein